MGEIAERFDLSVPSWLDPAGSYFDVREHTRFTGILCLFRAVAIDDRFATEAARFEPDGSVDITVYDEPGDARYKYDQHTEWVDRRRERLDAGVAQARGWWDRGEYLEHIEDRGAPEGMGPVSDVEIVYGVYHVNLFIEAVMRANPNSEDVAEATAVMHELLRALLDETVRHLDRAD